LQSTLSQCVDCRVRDDIEQEDVEEAFYRYMEENPMAGVYMEDDEVVDYDEVRKIFSAYNPSVCVNLKNVGV